MVKTAAEKQRPYRERCLEENRESYLEGKRQRKKKFRANRSRKQKFKETKKSRARVQRFREKKKASLNLTDSAKPAFKSPQTFGKALAKAKRALPRSPHKRMEVVNEIVHRAGGRLITAHSAVSLSYASSHSNLDTTVNNVVQEFYISDDISRQAPGKKEFVTIKNGAGSKDRVQKRHMLMTIMEAYSLFTERHPDISIKKSKFFRLRPKYVLINQLMPHNVCLCKYHENYRLLHTSIARACAEFPKSINLLLSKMVCSRQNEACMFSRCAQCPGFAFVEAFIPPNALSWDQWKNQEKRLVRMNCTSAIAEALKELKRQTCPFLVHSFIKYAQSSEFQRLRGSHDPTIAILQVDFSENYLAQYQDEIQSAHWQNQQITVFTAVVWTCDFQPKSYAIISDYLEHNKYAVNSFLQYLLSHIAESHKNVTTVHIFSDGAASQFKQRYNFANLFRLQEQFGLSLAWHFFATSHGKGAVDGIGGTIKRTVWRKVRSSSRVVRDASTFAQVAKSENTSIHVCFISELQILADKDRFDENCTGISSIPDTQRNHYCKPQTNYQLNCKLYSSAEDGRTYCMKQVPSVADNAPENPSHNGTTSQHISNLCITCGTDFYNDSSGADWIACQHCEYYCHNTRGCLLGSLDELYYSCQYCLEQEL